MEEMSTFDLGTFLDALDGIAYVADPEGIILATCSGAWVEFSVANQAHLPTESVVGRSLFEIIRGEEVRAAHRALHQKVLRDGRQLSFEYRCDAPDRERRMKMSLGPLRNRAGAMAGVLYQSTLLSETTRIPLPFLSSEELLAAWEDERTRPVVGVCAWCADVRLQGRWIPPDEYYRRGGRAGVRRSHGIGPGCRETLLEPLLADTSRRLQSGG